jgi:hypothetical protein
LSGVGTTLVQELVGSCSRDAGENRERDGENGENLGDWKREGADLSVCITIDVS